MAMHSDEQITIHEPLSNGTSHLSEAEIRIAQEAIATARERDKIATGNDLMPVVEWVEITRAEVAFTALEQCPHCHNEEPPPGGPYCDCHFGQIWKATHQGIYERERERLAESRRRQLEKQFGCMEVPRRFRDLSPATLTTGEIIGKEAAIDAAGRWLRGETGKPGLLVHGLPGVGKSALGWWAVPQRGWGLWQTWPEFYKAVQDGYSGGDAEAKVRAAQTVPVLFLDDLGDPDRQRMATDDQRDILFRVVNHRVKEWTPIFVTSNLDGAGLFTQFGDRIVSRLLELCEFVEMGGADLRRLRR